MYFNRVYDKCQLLRPYLQSTVLIHLHSDRSAHAQDDVQLIVYVYTK